jgi:hypothetical protein
VLEREASEAEVSESAKKFVERVRGYAAKREQATADLLSRWLGASP